MKKYSRLVVCKLASLLLLTVFIFPAMAAELYKWVDKNGKITYQATPPPGNAASVEKSKITTGNENVKDSSTTEEANKTASKLEPIKFYIEEKCEPCSEARAYLEETSVPYEEINLTDNTDEAEELEKKLGVLNFPIFDIGGKIISGFQGEMLSKVLSKDGYKIPPNLHD